MLKAINAAQTETRTFTSYAEAYRFVMREGDRSRLWSIHAANINSLEVCKAQKAAFFAKAA